jgi:glycosyltransferase involved in cell wall biosynthesis
LGRGFGEVVHVALDMRLAGYRGGGIARYARELHTALAETDGVEVRALRSRRDATGASGDLRMRTPPHHRLERFTVPVELGLARYRPDVYHATDFIAPHLPGVPFVATVHDLAFVHWPDDLTPDALEYYRQIGGARRRTAAWITPSRWTAGDLAGIYGIDPATIHVIPHGVSLDLLAERPRGRAERGHYVLAVGTVEPRKQYELLLAASQTGRDLPKIVIAGAAGWNSGGIEARLRSARGVEWLDDSDDAALRRLYAEAIAVVIPSRAEGFGLPALEAMAVGTPVVSSGGGALPEVTGEAALTVEEASGEGWAAAIERIATDDELWERLSAAGRGRAQEYSWERAANATKVVYRRLVG